MMKKLYVAILLILSAFNLVYIVALYDSFIQEYMLNQFKYWGFPQWGWMYESPATYFYSNIFLLLLLSSLWLLGYWFWKDFEYKRSFICMGWVFAFFLVLTYLPLYYLEDKNLSQSDEQNILGKKLPQGRWLVYPDDVEYYEDEAFWEKFKNLMGRGNWPGGYPVWGEYRAWMRPDFFVEEDKAKGVVLQGRTKKNSPWGVFLGDDIAALLRGVKQGSIPMDVNITYSTGSESSK